jgi:site-specific recombinase XerC
MADIADFLGWMDGAGEPTGLGTIDQDQLLRYLEARQGLSANTLRRRVHALSAWFRYLVDRGQMGRNPAQGLPLPRRTRRLAKCPTADQCQRLLGAARTPFERAIAYLLVGTGLRRSELLSLDLTSLADDLSELRVVGKGHKERPLPLPLAVQDALAAYLQVRGSHLGPLLLNRVGKRLGVTSLNRVFTRLLRRAGLPDCGFHLHSMRHAYATMLVKAGVDLGTIRDLLGHSDIAVTSVYLHSDLRSRREAVEHLPIMGAALGGGVDG